MRQCFPVDEVEREHLMSRSLHVVIGESSRGRGPGSPDDNLKV
jgi:hypothetical protein